MEAADGCELQFRNILNLGYRTGTSDGKSNYAKTHDCKREHHEVDDSSRHQYLLVDASQFTG
jgi:hypothetical protein